MVVSPASASPDQGRSRFGSWGPVIVALTIIAAFANGVFGALLLDDEINLIDNESLRNLSALPTVLFPPHEVLTAGRPLLNLSFALNYACGGFDPRGYHAVNIAIHAAAALTLFGLVRRVLAQARLSARFSLPSEPVAVAAALLWALHPLQTASVTYVSQRAESLMGLAYFLTLYAFVRAVERPRSAWAAIAVVCCIAGMLVKEVMVTAPLMALLFDRAFFSGSFKAAWQARRGMYLGLAGSWLVLAALMLATSVQRRGVGYAFSYSWASYFQIEVAAVAHYFRLAFWPWPLVFDYGEEIATPAPLVLAISGGLLTAVAAAAIWAWRRCPPLGFLGAWYFVILSPTSSLVPVAGQPIAENRVYLPLAAVAVGAAVVGYRLLGRWATTVIFPLLAGFALLVIVRNQTYQSPLKIWTETAALRPDSARAHSHQGNALLRAGRIAEGIAVLNQALRIRPTSAQAHTNLGIAYGLQRNFPVAFRHFETSLALNPNVVSTYLNFGTILFQADQPLTALAQYDVGLRLSPGKIDLRINRAIVLGRLGRFAEAIAEFEEVLRLSPGDRVAAENLRQLRALQAPGRQP